MPTLQLTVPARNTEGSRLKIRAREISDWLDDLPYMDAQRAARTASEQLRLMNRQSLAAGVRLDILHSFLAAWQRLNDSLPTTAAQRDAVNTELDYLCQDIGFGYKIIVHELVNRRSGFMEQRHLPQALLGAIYTLGLQQRRCYDNHKRLPRALWTEFLDLFLYAQEKGQAHYRGQLPAAGLVSIEDCFKLMALIRLSDPYSSPPGLTALLTGYFDRHRQLIHVHTTPPEAPNNTGIVLNVQHRTNNEPGAGHLYLDLSHLGNQLARDLQKLQAGEQAVGLGLPAEIPSPMLQNTLSQLHEIWKKQVQRKDERETAHSTIELISGLEAIFCALNMGRRFDPSMFLESGTDTDIDLGTLPAQTPSPASRPMAEPLRCNCANRCNGGLALEYRGNGQLTRMPQAGQLVAVRRPGAQSSQGWVIGICRWLIGTENHQGFDLGLQYIIRQPYAVVVKTAVANGKSTTFQPALIARQQRGGKPVLTLITAAGLLQTGDQALLYERAKPHPIRCIESLPSGTRFDRHLYEPE